MDELQNDISRWIFWNADMSPKASICSELTGSKLTLLQGRNDTLDGPSEYAWNLFAGNTPVLMDLLSSMNAEDIQKDPKSMLSGILKPFSQREDVRDTLKILPANAYNKRAAPIDMIGISAEAQKGTVFIEKQLSLADFDRLYPLTGRWKYFERFRFHVQHQGEYDAIQFVL